MINRFVGVYSTNEYFETESVHEWINLLISEFLEQQSVAAHIGGGLLNHI